MSMARLVCAWWAAAQHWDGRGQLVFLGDLIDRGVETAGAVLSGLAILVIVA